MLASAPPSAVPSAAALEVMPGFTPIDYSKSVPEDADVPKRPAYMLGVADAEAAMRELAAVRPDLVTVSDIGDSGEKVAGFGGSDILAMRISGPAPATAAKPRVVLTAGLHPREVVPGAVLLQWARQVVEAYGRDPVMTRLLDSATIDIVPVTNPDGLEVVERGLGRQPHGAHLQRTNTSTPHGVNINRNFDTEHWGVETPNSGRDLLDPSNPDGNYAGPTPSSEPETRVIQRFLAQEPTAAFTDWHTYGEWVMSTPTGGTPRAQAASRALAERVAGAAGLPFVQVPTDIGMAIDWAQAKLDVPSALAEIGGDRFIPDDAAYAKVYKRVAPAVTAAVQFGIDASRGAGATQLAARGSRGQTPG